MKEFGAKARAPDTMAEGEMGFAVQDFDEAGDDGEQERDGEDVLQREGLPEAEERCCQGKDERHREQRTESAGANAG